MAKYEVTSPDGKVYEVEAPDNATEAQVLAYAQQQAMAAPPPAEPKQNTKPFWKNALSEIYGGLTDIDPAKALGAPVPLGAAIEALTNPGGKGVELPQMGDPQFHNSATGRGFRYVGPALIPMGKGTIAGKAAGTVANAGAAYFSGVLDKMAEDRNAPAWERVAANLAPAVGLLGLQSAVRGGFRGGPNAASEMRQNISNAESIGIKDYSVGQVAPENNSRLPLAERAISYLFGGQGPFSKLAKTQGEQAQASLENVAGGSANQADQAGATVWRGLFGENGWVSRTRAAEKGKWAPVDAAIQKATVDVPVAEVKPVWNEQTQMFSGGSPARVDKVPGLKPTNYRKALEDILGTFDDPKQGAALQSDKVAAKSLLDALDANGGVMTVNDFQQARNLIGESNSGSKLVPGERSLSDRQAGKLWAAMLEDYKTLADQHGVSAEFEAARKFSKDYHVKSRSFFKTVFGNEAEPTKIIDEMVSGNFQKPAKWQALRQALAPEDFKQVQEYVINRLGVPGGSSANNWSLATFHTNYKNAFGSSARSGNAVADSVLGKVGTPTRDALETLFKFADKSKQGAQVLYNSSQTAPAIMASGTVDQIIKGLMRSVPAAVGAGGAAAAGAPAAGAAAMAVAGVGANNMLARAMTSPRFARWIAKSSLSGPERIPAALAVLSKTKLETPELEDLKNEFIKQMSIDRGNQVMFSQ